ncbi:MAG: cell division topological specificity factor MinE [Anaerolineales bacterium]
MANVLARLVGRSKPKSREVAKERLKLVLVHDRADLSPAIVEQLRDAIITTIAKYVDFDRDQVDIRLSRDSRENRLIADIPLLKSPRNRRRR